MAFTTPIFVFDSREKWFPAPVEESLRLSKARTPVELPVSSTLHRNDGLPRIDFPADMKPLHLPPVGYRRVKAGGGLAWEQYWLWYPYNPGPPLLQGIGRHEGDWEFVQIGYAGDTPVLMTCSQHKTGGKREFWSVETREGRPVIYVAEGSHANFFAPGVQGGGIDRCDGKGKVLKDIDWRPFGKWSDWDGLWGNSTGEGRSPQSPGRQGKRWSHPHLYHSESK